MNLHIIVLDALMNIPNARIGIVYNDVNHAKKLMALLATYIELNGKCESCSEWTLKGINGSIIMPISANGNIEGLSFDCIVIDEQSPIDEEIFKTKLLPTVAFSKLDIKVVKLS